MDSSNNITYQDLFSTYNLKINTDNLKLDDLEQETLIGVNTKGNLHHVQAGTGVNYAYDSKTDLGTVSVNTSGLDHGDLTGLNDDDHKLYHNDSRADTWLTTKTTDNITEGTNLYFTQARARSSISATGPVSYDSATGLIDSSNLDTDDVAEASNLYFTQARARSAMTGANGIQYDASSGLITASGIGTNALNLSTHTSNTSNPHNVTKAQLNLDTTDSPTFAGLTLNGNIVISGLVDGVDVSSLSSVVTLNSSHRQTTTGNPHNVTKGDLSLDTTDNVSFGGITTTGDINGASPAEMAQLSGVTENIQDWFDAHSDSLQSLTTHQVDQLRNIGALTNIDATNWSKMSTMDQDVRTSDAVEFSSGIFTSGSASATAIGLNFYYQGKSLITSYDGPTGTYKGLGVYASDIEFYPGGSKEMSIIGSTGKVGIGSDSPNTKLEVSDSNTQLSISHTDPLDKAEFSVDANGDLSIDVSGDNTDINSTIHSGRLTVTSGSVYSTTQSGFNIYHTGGQSYLLGYDTVSGMVPINHYGSEIKFFPAGVQKLTVGSNYTKGTFLSEGAIIGKLYRLLDVFASPPTIYTKYGFNVAGLSNLMTVDTATSRITITHAGWYEVTSHIAFSSGSADTFYAYIYYNGANFATTHMSQTFVANSRHTCSARDVVQCSVGDYLEVFFYVQGGSSINITTWDLIVRGV